MQLKANRLHLPQVKCLAKILQIIAYKEAITVLKFYLLLLETALLTADLLIALFAIARLRRALPTTLLTTARLTALFATARFTTLRFTALLTAVRFTAFLTADRFAAFRTTARLTALRLAARLTNFAITN